MGFVFSPQWRKESKKTSSLLKNRLGKGPLIYQGHWSFLQGLSLPVGESLGFVSALLFCPLHWVAEPQWRCAGAACKGGPELICSDLRSQQKVVFRPLWYGAVSLPTSSGSAWVGDKRSHPAWCSQWCSKRSLCHFYSSVSCFCTFPGPLLPAEWGSCCPFPSRKDIWDYSTDGLHIISV